MLSNINRTSEHVHAQKIVTFQNHLRKISQKGASSDSSQTSALPLETSSTSSSIESLIYSLCANRSHSVNVGFSRSYSNMCTNYHKPPTMVNHSTILTKQCNNLYQIFYAPDELKMGHEFQRPWTYWDWTGCWKHFPKVYRLSGHAGLYSSHSAEQRILI